MPGTVLNSLHIFMHLILLTILQGGYNGYLHFTDQETEAGDSHVTYLRSHGPKVANLNPGDPVPKPRPESLCSASKPKI